MGEEGDGGGRTIEFQSIKWTGVGRCRQETSRRCLGREAGCVHFRVKCRVQREAFLKNAAFKAANSGINVSLCLTPHSSDCMKIQLMQMQRQEVICKEGLGCSLTG